MFYEKEMIQALQRLMAQFDRMDRTAVPRQHGSEEIQFYDIDLPAVCQCLVHQAQTVCQFAADMTGTPGYRGKDLFGQRAVKLTSALQSFTDRDWICTEKLFELWMLEDMTFVVADAVFITVRLPEGAFHTEYRGVKWPVSEKGDLPFHPLDFLDDLEVLGRIQDGAPCYIL